MGVGSAHCVDLIKIVIPSVSEGPFPIIQGPGDPAGKRSGPAAPLPIRDD